MDRNEHQIMQVRITGACETCTSLVPSILGTGLVGGGVSTHMAISRMCGRPAVLRVRMATATAWAEKRDHGTALNFQIVAECPVTKARVSKMSLPHHTVDTPVFMPVGTQGTLKGITPQQLEALDCQILLGNTYHLGHRPVGGAA